MVAGSLASASARMPCRSLRCQILEVTQVSAVLAVRALVLHQANRTGIGLRHVVHVHGLIAATTTSWGGGFCCSTSHACLPPLRSGETMVSRMEGTDANILLFGKT